MTAKLTKKSIDAFEATGKLEYLWDMEVKGFGVVSVSLAAGPARSRVTLCHCLSSPVIFTPPLPSGWRTASGWVGALAAGAASVADNGAAAAWSQANGSRQSRKRQGLGFMMGRKGWAVGRAGECRVGGHAAVVGAPRDQQSAFRGRVYRKACRVRFAGSSVERTSAGRCPVGQGGFAPRRKGAGVKQSARAANPDRSGTDPAFESRS